MFDACACNSRFIVMVVTDEGRARISPPTLPPPVTRLPRLPLDQTAIPKPKAEAGMRLRLPLLQMQGDQRGTQARIQEGGGGVRDHDPPPSPKVPGAPMAPPGR